VKKIENLFSWSVSRHRVFTECRRQYYYRHYGSWGGWDESAPPRTRQIYILKQLGNRFTLAGNVVHEVVADVLNKHRYGYEVPLEKAQESALERLREAFRQSRSGAYRESPRQAVGLFEHEYAEPIADAEWRRMKDRVMKCLEHFYVSQIREIILQVGIENWLPIDEVDSFVFEGVTVYVAPDFAIKNQQGNALLIDWKTGRSEMGEDRMQMVCYGLFAREKWGVEPSRTVGELHYLLTRQSGIVTLDDATLVEGMELIRGSIRDMRALLADPELNLAVEEAFPKTEDRAICEHCNYRKVCWPDWPARFDPTSAGAEPMGVVPPGVSC
jgi:CRISPR/Cas system-associated exonuclease Cas4 (RecB family)